MARSGLQKRRRAQSRREILEAAREIVSREGAGAMTLSAVAERVGVTTPALYYYFDSKEALLQALIVSWISDEADMLVKVSEGWEGDEGAVFAALVRAMYEHYRANLSAFRLVYLQMQIAGPDSMGFDEALLTRIHPHSKRIFDALQTVIERGQAGGVVDPDIDARTAAVAAHAASTGLLVMIGLAERVSDPLKQTDHSLLHALCKLFVDGARQGGAETTREPT